MNKFSMKCTCGHIMTVDAGSRDEAISKFKQMMDQKMLDEHWNMYHKEDTSPKPTVDQAHTMIDQGVVEGELPSPSQGTPPPPPAAPPAGGQVMGQM